MKVAMEYGVTGSDRKAFVAAIGEILGIKPKYLGMPTAAYQIGDFTVDRNGALVSDGNGLKELIDDLADRGYAPTAPKSDPGDGLEIEIPIENVNVENLQNLLSAKGTLIGKALGVTAVPMEVRETSVAFPWFETIPSPEEAAAVLALIDAMCKMSMASKRISAKEKPVDNEKYAFRCFLLRLGFIGDEYKAIRKTLLKNMAGNSAFKAGKAAGN